jgi:ATP-binding cassette, subfamily B, bacterial
MKASTKATLRFCAESCRPYRGRLTASGLCVIAGVLIGDVATLVILYAVLLLLGTVVWRLAGWLEWEAATRSFTRSVSLAFERLISLGYRWHVDHPSGEVSSTLSTFSWALMESIDQITWGLLRIFASTLSAIVVLLVVAWPVGLTLAVFSVLFIALMIRRSKAVTEASTRFSAAHTAAEGAAFDVIRNVLTVMAHTGERLEQANVDRRLEASVQADLGARRVFTVTRTWMSTVVNTMSWAALFVGVILALHHDISAGVVYLVLFYSAAVSQQIIESFQVVRSLSRALGRATKLVALIDTVPEVVDAPDSRALSVPEGEIAFKAVSFRYTADKPLIEDLNLTIAPGEHLGVVGPSGGGKSTLTRLVLRFMDVTAGVIQIDGQALTAVSQRSLRRHISYVPQDPQMLHRSVAENIWLGREGAPDIDQIIEVSRAAHVHSFVSELPDGYDTIVGERGLKLSGGQRQRVAIAQAMLKRAPILILDEATSALDSESEALVQDALWKLMATSTSMVVAHRLSTISRLDRIVVVERGSVTDSGTHAELLSHQGTYHKLWQHQSGGFIR